MRLIFLCITIILFVPLVPYQLLGQVSFRDSTEVYDYWAKRGIIEMIYSYMEDVNSINNEEKKGKDEFRDYFITNLDTLFYDNVNADFQKIEEFLVKNSWAATSENIFRQLKRNYENFNSINLDFFSITGKGQGYREKGENCLKTQEKIINAYKLDLSDVKKPIVNDAMYKQDNLILLNTEKNHEEVVKYKYWNILRNAIFFLFGFVAGLTFINYIIKRQIFSIIVYEKKNYLNELHSTVGFFPKWLGFIALLKKSKDHYKDEYEKNNNELNLEISYLKSEIQKLRDENTNLISEKDSLEKSHEIYEENTSSKYEATFELPKPSVINMYFSIPDNQGRFRLENGKKHNDGKNFYRIEFEENDTIGKLYFINSELDKRAIIGIENYLSPVCDILNFSSRINSDRIQVLHHGVVVFKNEYWVIDPNNKVRIKLV